MVVFIDPNEATKVILKGATQKAEVHALTGRKFPPTSLPPAWLLDNSFRIHTIYIQPNRHFILKGQKNHGKLTGKDGFVYISNKIRKLTNFF